MTHLGATYGSWEVVPGFFALSTQAGASKNDPEGPVPAKPAGNQQDFPSDPRPPLSLDILDVSSILNWGAVSRCTTDCVFDHNHYLYGIQGQNPSTAC